ncbi:MAG: Dam family site-specific DNA-(adenine-N6)-methyltransferase, partial [Ruminococcus sp.]|nr:Dam family site-specific DNA-(adenine-N6)-methyltransferase [Ruminococcus sp.]
MEYRTVKPFIKWAGGKSQLLSEIRRKYPEKIERYCEPFVGGGAVLLDILTNFRPKEILINDINAELMNLYTQIRDNVEFLIENLSELQDLYWKMNENNRKAFYIEQRKRFNFGIQTDNVSGAEMAYLFIFLNKTCFNGLYRVNKKGLFNVPIGSYKEPPVCDAANLRLVSSLLRNVQIICGDYSETADFINENTFVYIDPPYRPISATASFTSYSSVKFGDDEQLALSRFINKISDYGAKVIVSNSDPKNFDESDNFFDTIYSDYNILR